MMKVDYKAYNYDQDVYPLKELYAKCVDESQHDDLESFVAFRREACEKSFIIFLMIYFHKYINYRIAPHHYTMEKDLLDMANGRVREVAWFMYRESGKTTYAKLFVVWLICLNKKKYINVDSFDNENSERILFDVVDELTSNFLLKRDFGVLFNRKKNTDKSEEIKTNRINNFVTTNGIRVEAHSTQQSVRGRLHQNQRPDFLIMDDFENNLTKDSEAYTKKIRNHISEALGGMAPDGNILYLGNYITEKGNVQALLDRAQIDDQLVIRDVPVLLDRDKLAWPDKYALTDEEAKATGKVSIPSKIKQLGQRVFTYEMMNQPIDEMDAEFKKEWWQVGYEHQVIGKRTNCFVIIDSAVAIKERSDYTGVSIVRVCQDNKWWVKTERHKINSTALLELIFTLQNRWKPDVLALEETLATQTLGPLLSEEMRRRNNFFSITYAKTGGVKKEERIRSLIPRFQNQQIYLIGDNEYLKDEARAFPNGLHDDVLDSLAHADKLVFPPERVTPQTIIEAAQYGIDERSGYLR